MPVHRSGNLSDDLINDTSPQLGGDLDANGFDIRNITELQLAGGAGTEGTFSWNADEETVDLIQNGATLQIGQETHIHCRNNTGVQIDDGTPVMATGTIGASSRITIAPMDATNPANAKFFLGVTTEDIPAGTDGKVTFFGKIRNIDTSTFLNGDVLWLSTTVVGGFTTTEPTVGIKKAVGYVINAASNGTIFVRWTPSFTVEDLINIDAATIVDDSFLQYDSASGNWSGTTTINGGTY